MGETRIWYTNMLTAEVELSSRHSWGCNHLLTRELPVITGLEWQRSRNLARWCQPNLILGSRAEGHVIRSSLVGRVIDDGCRDYSKGFLFDLLDLHDLGASLTVIVGLCSVVFVCYFLMNRFT